MSGAMENYKKTIGHLEPSYVITKFLDAHKIDWLTEYLQALHASGRQKNNNNLFQRAKNAFVLCTSTKYIFILTTFVYLFFVS